jgi:hypothetical protein
MIRKIRASAAVGIRGHRRFSRGEAAGKLRIVPDGVASLCRKALIRDYHTSTASRMPYCRNSLARGGSIRRHAVEQPIPQDQRVKQNRSKMGDEREE